MLGLAHALTMTRDGIVSYWPADPASLQSPVKPKDLRYLSGNRRVQMLLGALSGLFEVVEVVGGAELKTRGAVAFKTGTPDATKLKSQMALVGNYAELRIDRNTEIVAQAADIMQFFGSVANLFTPARKHSFELLSAVQSLCVLIEMQMKHLCWTPRPIDFAPQIFPVIDTPDHSSFPSGHATEAFALAAVLHRLMTGENAATGTGKWAMPFRLAHRIAVNRTIAGLHFPIDSAAGALLGCAIGDAVFALSNTGGKIAPRSFVAEAFTGDFEVNWLKKNVQTAADGSAATSHPLAIALWDMAKEEWPAPQGEPVP
jgi:membrane-associated phospholipid phosphatase